MTDQELKDLVASLAVDGKETDRRMQETDKLLKETAAMQKETAAMQKETDRIVKENAIQLKELKNNLDKLGVQVVGVSDNIGKLEVQVSGVSDNIGKLGVQVGGINDNIGFHAEQYFQDILKEKLTFGGQKYDRMIPNLECFGKNKVSLIEFDIVLVNGKSVAIIETKNRIHPKFVRQFVEERLPKFREFFPGFSKCRAYLGIAGFSFSKKVLEEAQKYGIGVVRQVGDSIEIETSHLKAY